MYIFALTKGDFWARGAKTKKQIKRVSRAFSKAQRRVHIWKINALTRTKETLFCYGVKGVKIMATLAVLLLGSTFIAKGETAAQPNLDIELTNIYPQKFKKETRTFEIAESLATTKAKEAKRTEIAKAQAEAERVRLVARATQNRVETSRPAKIKPNLADLRALYKRAAEKFGVDWKLIEAVHQVESGKSGDTAVKSYAGAQGPMQFIPSTFRKYAEDADGDGVAKINDVDDAVFAAAKLLAANGAAGGNENRALFAYNHAQWYVNKVQSVKNSITE